jgi:hypothetical protein
MAGSPRLIGVVNPFDENESGESGSSSTITAINLADNSSGSGTAADPWTGWNTAIVLGTVGTGTIGVTHSTSSVAVVGVGTLFTEAAAVGKWLCVVTASGVSAGKISAITNNLALTVESWNGPTIVAGVFRIYTPTALYAPAGYYSFASEWHIGFPMLSLRGDGTGTRFIHTGAGKAVCVQGDYTALASASQLIDVCGFTVQGTTNTTYALYIDNVNHFSVRDVYVHNATTAGIAVKDVVIGCFSNVKYTGNFELPSSPVPSYGWWFSGAHKVALYGCSSEVAGYGVYIASAEGLYWSGGTIEGNTTHGLFGSNFFYNSVIDGVDFEANPTYDVHLEGSGWIALRNLDSSGTIRFGSNVGAGAYTFVSSIDGGRLNSLVLDAGIGLNSFRNFSVGEAGGTITDNAGGASTWYNVVNRGTGAFYPSTFATFGLLSVRNAAAGLPGLATASGFGGSPSFAVEAGSSETSMVLTVTVSAGAGATGSVTMAFTPALAAGKTYAVAAMLENGTGSWDAGAVGHLTSRSNASFAFAWSNAGVALTNGSTYKFQFILIGH